MRREVRVQLRRSEALACGFGPCVNLVPKACAARDDTIPSGHKARRDEVWAKLAQQEWLAACHARYEAEVAERKAAIEAGNATKAKAWDAAQKAWESPHAVAARQRAERERREWRRARRRAEQGLHVSPIPLVRAEWEAFDRLVAAGFDGFVHDDAAGSMSRDCGVTGCSCPAVQHVELTRVGWNSNAMVWDVCSVHDAVLDKEIRTLDEHRGWSHVRTAA